jgi:hypothetical protein
VAKGMTVAANIAKPLTGVLMIVAMPAAITLEKVLQSLDYLNYMNVEDLPRNIRVILEFTSQGSLFGNINFFGDFYKFDDGDDSEQQEEGQGGRLRIRRTRILSVDTAICRTHKILSKEGLSCNCWNNTGLYFIQLALLSVLMGFMKFVGNWSRKVERKKLNKATNQSRTDKIFEEINEQNGEVKVKRKWFFRLIFFIENIFSLEFFMSFFLGV